MQPDEAADATEGSDKSALVAQDATPELAQFSTCHVPSEGAMRRNDTTHTQGFASQAPGPWMDCQRPMKWAR